MVVAEEVYRYPRRLRGTVELLTGTAVVLAVAYMARNLLRFFWALFGIDTTYFARVPLLAQAVDLINAGIPVLRPYAAFVSLLQPLAWLAFTLFFTLLVRNGLPTIRTSPRGILVEFAGGWLPVPWESLKAIKVTEDVEAKRYVLLAETDPTYLTGWHRWYSLLYRLGFGRGFLITSAISDFERLIKALLTESDRVARVMDHVKPAQLQEEAISPLFRFLLSPSSFFGASKKAPAPEAPRPASATGPATTIQGSYPARFSRLFGGAALLLALGALFVYIVSWLKFLALTFPDLLRQPVFSQLRLVQGQLEAPWWALVAGHLALFVLLGLAVVLANILPELEARREGLAVRHFGRWITVPWERVVAIKETTLSDTSKFTLIQTRGVLPFSSRFRSLIYDGSFAPGIPVASAISNADALLERVLLEATRHQVSAPAPDAPLLDNEARSNLLLMTFRAGSTIDLLIDEARQTSAKELSTPRLLGAARQMALLAVLPALLAFFDRAVAQGLPPDARLITGVVVLFLLGMLEWPLSALGAQTLDDMTGGGEEGNRPLYLYPQVQLPRALPLLGAVVLGLLGVPLLPVLLWIAAIFWSFLLAAGLWEGLYGWSGTQLLAGGLVPVVFQLLILLGYLVAFR